MHFGKQTTRNNAHSRSLQPAMRHNCRHHCGVLPHDHVILSLMGLGRNPTTWDERLHFKPERHIRDNINVVFTKRELRFISFSTGQPRCIATSIETTMSVLLFWQAPAWLHLDQTGWGVGHQSQRVQARPLRREAASATC